MLFVLVLVSSLLFQFFLPWWIIAPVAAVLSFWKASNGKHAFISAFFALNILWIVMSLVQTVPNHHILLDRVAGLFALPAGVWSRILLIIVTGFAGGLTAGIAALAGYYWKEVLAKKKLPGK